MSPTLPEPRGFILRERAVIAVWCVLHISVCPSDSCIYSTACVTYIGVHIRLLYIQYGMCYIYRCAHQTAVYKVRYVLHVSVCPPDSCIYSTVCVTYIGVPTRLLYIQYGMCYMYRCAHQTAVYTVRYVLHVSVCPPDCCIYSTVCVTCIGVPTRQLYIQYGMCYMYRCAFQTGHTDALKT